TRTVSARAPGQNWVTSPATSAPVRISQHPYATVPLQVKFPTAPGDHPETVQFVAANGAKTSLAIARRTLIPSDGGEFDTHIIASVGRGNGHVSSFNINQPAARANHGLVVNTPP